MEENKVYEIEEGYHKLMKELPISGPPTKREDEFQEMDFQELTGYEILEYGTTICRASDAIIFYDNM